MPLRPPLIEDAKVLARYPFYLNLLRIPGPYYLKGISMEDLLSAAWLSDIVVKGICV